MSKSVPQADCARCPLRDRPAISPSVLKNAKLIICGEAPGYTEELRNEFFVGASGQVVNRLLDRFGVERHTCHITNALLCRPNWSMSPAEWKLALACCAPRLSAELAKCKATVGLALGGKALEALTDKRGIFNWCGSPLAYKDNPERTIYATVHPAFCMRPDGRSYFPVLSAHTQRACMAANGTPQPWSWPTPIIEPNKKMLDALRHLVSDNLPVAVDVETQGIDPLHAKLMCVGLANSKRGVSIPWESYDAGKKYGIAAGITDYGKIGAQIERLVTAILANESLTKVFHNAQHDILSLEAHGMPVRGTFADTILQHALIAPGIRHGLGFAASLEFNCDSWKTDFHAGTDSKGEDAFVKRDPEDLRRYNLKDTVATARLYDRLCKQIKKLHNGPALLHNYVELTKLTIEMRRGGIRINTDVLAKHRKGLSARKARARIEIRQLCKAVGFTPKPDRRCKDWRTNERAKRFKPAASGQVRELFKFLGAASAKVSRLSGAQSFDDEVLTDLLGHPKEAVAIAARVLLRYRRWSKLLATYIDGMPISEDGFVHPSWKVWGTITGRWACVAGSTLLYTTRGAFRMDHYIPQDGDKVLTHRMRLRNVVRKYVNPVATIYRVVLSSGDELLCTGDHLVNTPSGWLPVLDLRIRMEVLHVNKYTASERLYAGHKSCTSVYHGQRSSNDRAGSQAVRNQFSDSAVYYTEECAEEPPLERESKKIQSFETRHEQSMVWNTREKSSKLQRGVFRLQGLPDTSGWFEEIFRASVDRVQSPWGISKQLEQAPVRTPSGRESVQQQAVEPGCMYLEGSSSVTPTTCRVEKIEKVGRAVVYDIEVDEDHSYWAGGMFCHNCAEPNVMNIPQPRKRQSKVDPDKKILVAPGLRELFAADSGQWWMKGDKSQLELRIIAQQAKDDVLLKWYEEKVDVHARNAFDLFGVEHATKTERTLAKRFVYAANYLAEAETIWRSLLVDFPWLQLSDIVRLLSRWFNKHPQIVRWQQRLIKRARECGYTEEPMSGWREYFVGSPEANKVVNFPIQAMGATIVNAEALQLRKVLDDKNERLIVQCHDELCISTSNPCATLDKFKKYMQTTVTLDGVSMQYLVDVAVGPDWGTTTEVKSHDEIGKALVGYRAAGYNIPVRDINGCPVGVCASTATTAQRSGWDGLGAQGDGRSPRGSRLRLGTTKVVS